MTGTESTGIGEMIFEGVVGLAIGVWNLPAGLALAGFFLFLMWRYLRREPGESPMWWRR